MSLAEAGCMVHLQSCVHITRNRRSNEEVAHNERRQGEDKHMGRVVALMDDLFFQMKMAETAKQLGVELKVATNGDALMGLLESAPKLVIVDLNARSQPIQAIEKLRQARKDIRVVGFLSHVQRELAAQAQAAGCDEVMPRSSFTQNLAAIMSAARD
jgi:DNA-binding NarL/FixJ family response regulator